MTITTTLEVWWDKDYIVSQSVVEKFAQEMSSEFDRQITIDVNFVTKREEGNSKNAVVYTITFEAKNNEYCELSEKAKICKKLSLVLLEQIKKHNLL